MSDPRFEAPYGGQYWQVARNGAPVLRSRSLWDFTMGELAITGEGDGFALGETAGPEESEL